jgi:hypothetical protein
MNTIEKLLVETPFFHINYQLKISISSSWEPIYLVLFECLCFFLRYVHKRYAKIYHQSSTPRLNRLKLSIYIGTCSFESTQVLMRLIRYNFYTDNWPNFIVNHVEWMLHWLNILYKQKWLWEILYLHDIFSSQKCL